MAPFLRILVQGAKQLAKVSDRVKCQLQVVHENGLTSDVKSTKLVEMNTNPVWDEEFYM